MKKRFCNKEADQRGSAFEKKWYFIGHNSYLRVVFSLVFTASYEKCSLSKSDRLSKVPFMTLQKANNQNLVCGPLSVKYSDWRHLWLLEDIIKVEFCYQLLVATYTTESPKSTVLSWSSSFGRFLIASKIQRDPRSSLNIISPQSVCQCVIFSHCHSVPVCLFKCKIKALARASGTTGGSEKQRWGRTSAVGCFQHRGRTRFQPRVATHLCRGFISYRVYFTDLFTEIVSL